MSWSTFMKRGRGTQGAVMVEFLAVFMPLFTFFLGLVQLMYVHTANLVTKHAAHVAVRAAVVVVSDDPKFIGGAPNTVSGARLGEIVRAAKMPLSAVSTNPGAVSVALNGGAYGPTSPITVTVTLAYECKVPLGKLLVCQGATKNLTAEATMPNQGVEWEY